MSARRAARWSSTLLILICTGLLSVGPASAHVGITPDEAEAGELLTATMSVPHGCNGSPTIEVTVKIPEEVVAITPTRNANWDVKKTLVRLDTPIKDDDGNEISERVDKVVYTARNPLPDGYRDAFELTFQVPDIEGKRIVFPILQKCVKGSADWIQVADEGAAEPEYPASIVKVVPSAAHSVEVASEAGTSSTSSSGDGASKGLAYTGIAIGALGLIAAVGALALGRRKA